MTAGYLRALAMLLCLLSTLPASAQTQRTVPGTGYYFAKRDYYAGDYVTAEKGFRQALRSGLRIGTTRWVDSICYCTMLGEIYFHRGQLAQSLELHEQALAVHLQNPDWLGRIRYPTIAVSNRPIRSLIGWGTRATLLGEFPDSMSSLEGSFNLEQPFQVGGAVNPAHLRSVDAMEVARCLAVSLRRRAELLGPTASLTSLGGRMTSSMADLATPPGHWSAALVEVLYGLSLLADGQRESAVSHLGAGATAGQFDHPLTGMALLEQGKYLLAEGEYVTAVAMLLQASIAGAEFGQADVVEESLRYLTDAFLAGGAEAGYPPLTSAIVYAEREEFFRLAAALRLAVSDVALNTGDDATAKSLLSQARLILARQRLLPFDLGARLTYLEAIAQYRSGATKTANASIQSALAYMQVSSLPQFHFSIIESLYAQGRRALSPRQMDVLFSIILREPTDADWRVAPLESITRLLSPHTGTLERWFELLVDRRELDRAVQVAEQLRRHRFYASLPFGGRILSLRWLVEGDRRVLGKAGIAQQAELLQRYPQLAGLSEEVTLLQEELRKMPLAPADEDVQVAQRRLVKRLITRSQQQEAIIRELALRREPAKLVFPPQPRLSAIQRGMQEHQALLMFVTTSQGWHAWFIRREMDDYWAIRSPAKVRRLLAKLLREFGNRNANHDVSASQLAESNWQSLARQMWTGLIGEFPSQGWEGLEELVIVPDGVLWHLPFETLQVPADQIPDSEEDQSLYQLVRIRYAPTASLSVGEQRPHRLDLRTTIVGGKLMPKDATDYAAAMLASLKNTLPSLNVISKRLPPASAGYLGGLMDRIIAWNDVAIRGPFGWSPAQYDRGMAHASLLDWVEYPWGSPEQVILPGFHTAAETSLGNRTTGHEIFLTACALMATGTRTALLSRWRTGGQAPAVLVQHFTESLTSTSAADAWQQALHAVQQVEIDPQQEPRVRGSREEGALVATHPFFWGGYLLLDTGAEPAADPLVPEEAAEPNEDGVAAEDPVPVADGDEAGAADEVGAGDGEPLLQEAPEEPDEGPVPQLLSENLPNGAI